MVETRKFNKRNRINRAWFKVLRFAEGRSVLELQSFYLLRPLLRKLPSGDGHPVIVFPGFLASDHSTRPLRSLLSDLGYDTHGWGLGRNIFTDQRMLAKLPLLLEKIHAETGKTVSLIGWSLGGVYARELAKAMPNKVRCVISLGSPISGRSDHTNASNLFQVINGAPNGAGMEELAAQIDVNRPPPVPTTSIYSKTDGVVHWRGSVQAVHPFPINPQTENIELPASHLGLGVNAFAMVAIADRLAQQEGAWRPFAPTGWRAAIFRRPRQKAKERLRAVFSR